MRLFHISIGAAAIILSLPLIASACLCGMTDSEGAFLRAKVVLIGKVTKIVRAKEASVGLLMKESGTLEVLKVPRWKKSVYGAQIVTLEVNEAFKGTTKQTIEVLTAVYEHGATCGVNFKIGEEYLVYAYDRRLELSVEEGKLSKDQWTKEIRLKAAADKFNEQLPPYETNICARTEKIRFRKEEIETIRGFLKSGVWKKSEQQLPVRVIP